MKKLSLFTKSSSSKLPLHRRSLNLLAGVAGIPAGLLLAHWLSKNKAKAKQDSQLRQSHLLGGQEVNV